MEDIGEDGDSEERAIDSHTDFMLADFIINLAKEVGGYCGVRRDFDWI